MRENRRFDGSSFISVSGNGACTRSVTRDDIFQLSRHRKKKVLQAASGQGEVRM
jgi:hypothetical protein